MSAQVMSWLLHEGPRDIAGSELVVALVLAEHTNGETGVAYPSVPRIAWMARMSERQVQRVLSVLVERKFIDVAFEATNRRARGYRFCDFRGDTRVTPTKEAGVTSPAARGDIPGELGVTRVSPKRTDENVNDENTPPCPTDSPPKGTERKAGKRMPIPDDWWLTDATHQYALDNGIPAGQVEHVAAEFKHYWQGEGRVKANWDQTFQGRVREKAQYYEAKRDKTDINANIVRIEDAPRITPEERARLDRIRREALAKDGETSEERWARLHPEQAAGLRILK